jgi:hypothetical protein
MTNQVVFELNGKDAGLVRAWLNAKNSIAAYDSQLGKVDKTQQKNTQSAKQFDKAIGDQANRVIGLVSSYVSVASAIGIWRQAAEEAIQKTEEASKKQDELTRRYRLQAGLTSLQGAAAKQSIYKVAEQTASTSEQAFGGATALASTGFDAKEAQGPALKATLELIQAQQLAGKNVDAGQLAEAASKYLASQDKDKTGANLRELAIAIQGLKETPLKITDLEQLAKQGATLKGKIGYKEQLANFAMLLESMDAEKAGTGMREVALHLSTAGGAKDKTKALQSIGLKPGDVDPQQVGFEKSLVAIEEGLKKHPKVNRATFLKTLVEATNIAPFELMSHNQDKVKRYVAQEGDEAGFNAASSAGSSGRNAAERRQTVRLEQKRAEKDALNAHYRRALEEYELSQDRNDAQIGLRLKGFDTLTTFGMSPETAMKTVSGHDLVNTDKTSKGNKKNIQGIQDQLAKDFGSEAPGINLEKADVERANSDVQGQGEALKRQLYAARKSGDSEQYDLLRKQIEVLSGIQADLKAGRQINVSVTPAGSTAPAKPVAAAGITAGGSRQ